MTIKVHSDSPDTDRCPRCGEIWGQPPTTWPGKWLDLRGKHPHIDRAEVEVRESTSGVGWKWRSLTQKEIDRVLELMNRM